VVFCGAALWRRRGAGGTCAGELGRVARSKAGSKQDRSRGRREYTAESRRWFGRRRRRVARLWITREQLVRRLCDCRVWAVRMMCGGCAVARPAGPPSRGRAPRPCGRTRRRGLAGDGRARPRPHHQATAVYARFDLDPLRRSVEATADAMLLEAGPLTDGREQNAAQPSPPGRPHPAPRGPTARSAHRFPRKVQKPRRQLRGNLREVDPTSALDDC